MDSEVGSGLGNDALHCCGGADSRDNGGAGRAKRAAMGFVCIRVGSSNPVYSEATKAVAIRQT